MFAAHLHCHSHYSLLDGILQIPQITKLASQQKLTAAALTDNGTLFAAIDFYNHCLQQEIKPIIGTEIYVGQKLTQQHRLVLLAKNKTGYLNLIKLTTLANTDQFEEIPRLTYKNLTQFSEGLFCLSAGPEGEIHQLLINNKVKEATELSLFLQKTFPKNSFFLELQKHPLWPSQQKYWESCLQLATELQIPLLATNNIHYEKPQDLTAYQIMHCIKSGRIIQELNKKTNRHFDLAWKTPQEMAQIFQEVPQALENTQQLVDRCDLKLELNQWVFPYYPLPEKQTADENLKLESFRLLAEKIPEITPEYSTRLDYELDIIKTKGYSPYFLIVAQFANWMRKTGITTTTRGSAAGSLVSYALSITTIDPIQYKLPFERFLNPFRPSPPDIDLDIADNRREEVIQYAKEAYGSEKVAQICTFGTMAARAAFKDVARAMGHPYLFGDQVAKQIPEGSQGFPITLARALEESPELKELYDQDPDVQEVYTLAQTLEGSARHSSIHAAGVIIAPSELTDFVPLQLESKNQNKIISQYNMHDVEQAGLLKMDFLGIRNLSIIGDAIEIIQQTRGKTIDLYQLPLDDGATYKLLTAGQTMGVFQLSSSGMTKWLKKLKPEKLTDLMAIISLYRPGPMESIPEYIKRKENPAEVSYLVPQLKDILDMSYGIITYQDDVLLTAIHIAGYDWAEADKLRKAMGKKIPEEMVKQEKKFKDGCLSHGKISLDKANQLWELIKPFAAYGFNKAHGASYALVAYQTAYLKTNYPAEFMAALMTAEKDDAIKIAQAVKESKLLELTILPPDINQSQGIFTVHKDKDLNPKIIRFGLYTIKNVGQKIVDQIIEIRNKSGPFKSLTDFFSRIPSTVLNKRALESIIKAGTFNQFNSPDQILFNLDQLIALAKTKAKERDSGQFSLFGPSTSQETEFKLKPTLEKTDQRQLLAWEKELLGIYLSGHPLTKYQRALKDKTTPINDLPDEDQAVVLTAGLLSTIKTNLTKNKDTMLFASLEDTSSQIELIVFPKTYLKTQHLWSENALLLIKGRVTLKDDQKKLIVSFAKPLTDKILKTKSNFKINPSTSQKQTSYLQIKVPPNSTKANLEELRQILQKEPGKTPVYLILNGPPSRMIKSGLSVNLKSNLLKQLESTLNWSVTINQ